MVSQGQRVPSFPPKLPSCPALVHPAHTDIAAVWVSPLRPRGKCDHVEDIVRVQLPCTASYGVVAIVMTASVPENCFYVLTVQADMFQRASAKFEECTETATTWEDFMAALDRKHMVMAPW